MSKKKTSNYKQTLDKPMQKMQSYLYADDDVMEYFRKLNHILFELSKDVAIIKSEIAEINNMLKDRQGSLGTVQQKPYSDRKPKKHDVPVIEKPITSKL